jgi:hypothetical protein
MGAHPSVSNCCALLLDHCQVTQQGTVLLIAVLAILSQPDTMLNIGIDAAGDVFWHIHTSCAVSSK